MSIKAVITNIVVLVLIMLGLYFNFDIELDTKLSGLENSLTKQKINLTKLNATHYASDVVNATKQYKILADYSNILGLKTEIINKTNTGLRVAIIGDTLIIISLAKELLQSLFKIKIEKLNIKNNLSTIQVLIYGTI